MGAWPPVPQPRQVKMPSSFEHLRDFDGAVRDMCGAETGCSTDKSSRPCAGGRRQRNPAHDRLPPDDVEGGMLR